MIRWFLGLICLFFCAANGAAEVVFDEWFEERTLRVDYMFSGDSVAQLDKCNVGDVITVSFRIRGVRYTDKSGQPRIFTRINPYQVDVVRTANAPAYQQPVQPAPQYQQPVQQPQQAPPYRPASAPPQQPAPANYQSDLPFDKPNSNDLPY
jgi:hypothetical protein